MEVVVWEVGLGWLIYWACRVCIELFMMLCSMLLYETNNTHQEPLKFLTL